MSETSLQRLYEPVVGVHPPGFKEEQSRSGLAEGRYFLGWHSEQWSWTLTRITGLSLDPVLSRIMMPPSCLVHLRENQVQRMTEGHMAGGHWEESNADFVQPCAISWQLRLLHCLNELQGGRPVWGHRQSSGEGTSVNKAHVQHHQLLDGTHRWIRKIGWLYQSDS